MSLAMRRKGVRPPSVAAPGDGVQPSTATAAGDLSRRLASGDESALEECYRTLGTLVRSYLRRVVGGEAEDVLQVVFFELWRSRERLDPERSLEGFVFALARRRAIDHLRRHRPQLVDIDAFHWLVGEDGDAFVEQFVLAAQVKRALGDLPEEQRESLVLAYFEGKTQQEISDTLSIPMGTIKARMARGLRRLSVTMFEDRP
ncbi:MAG: RNA polymerase sigma factor [Acidimicrobiales bacterium]